MRVVAVDQGTTSTRAIVFEPGALPRLVLSRRHVQHYPQPGWVEHDPLELLADVEACLQAALQAAWPVDAIGLANQGESCLAWDHVSGEPLSRVIVWQDARTARDVEQLRADGFGEALATRAGLPLDPYFSASKLAWLLGTEPRVQAAHRTGRLRLGTTDSFFLRRLTGVDATDATTASRTGLMDLRTLTWDPVLCAGFGVPLDTLAPIRPTCGSFGAYRGVAVRASVVDQQAALYGHGCRRPGETKVTFGTGAFALALTAEPPAEPLPDGLISTVAWSTDAGAAYALEGGVYDAGGAIEWAIRIGVVTDPSELADLQGEPVIGQGLVFVPALSGLACPQWSRDAAGMWIGTTTATTRADLQRSLLEGVALQTREVIDALDRRGGRSDRLSLDGGLTASPYFLHFLADLLERPLVRPGLPELTALGCAGLAGFEGAIEAPPSTVYEPRPGARRDDQVQTYRHALERCRDWRALAPRG